MSAASKGLRGDIAEIAEEYILAKKAAGRDYEHAAGDVRRLARFLQERGCCSAVTRADFDAWVDLSSSRKGRQGRFWTMTAFCRFLRTRGFEVCDAEWKEYDCGTTFKARILSDEELERLFEAADSIGSRRRQIFDHGLMFPVILRLAYGCGLRLGEILALKESDVNLETGEIRVLNSKNGDSRVVYASESLAKVIADYMGRLHAYEGEGHLFRGADGRPYKKNAVERVMREARAAAGLDGGGQQPLRLHDLRHNFAVRSMEKMLDDGTDLYANMELLCLYMGHRGIAETEYYISLSSSRHHRISEKAEGLSLTVFPEIDWSEDE